MKAKFNRAALQEALSLVVSIVPSRTPKPLLQCLKVTADKEAVVICATDLEVGIHYRITQVEVEKEGEFVAPADKISAIIRESIDEVIEIEACEAIVHVRGADSHFTVYGQDPAQYPPVAGPDGQADFTVELAKLQEGIRQSVFATARESTRYALNGILWEIRGKKLTLVGTDGRRLAKAVASLAETAGKLPEGCIIVPVKTMQLVDRISAEASSLVGIRFVGNQVVLACEQVAISSNLVEGTFPKYEDIIPKEHDKKLTLPTEATLSAVKRAALLLTEESKGIRLGIRSGCLTVSGKAPETGDAQIEMAIDYDGAELEIGFNPQFLIDALRVIKSDDFEMNLGQADRPGVIKSGANFLYIVMPVSL